MPTSPYQWQASWTSIWLVSHLAMVFIITFSPEITVGQLLENHLVRHGWQTWWPTARLLSSSGSRVSYCKWNFCGISKPCSGRHGFVWFLVLWVHGLQCQKCRQWIGGSPWRRWFDPVLGRMFFLVLGERSCFLGGSKHYFFSTGRSIALDR